ncbi:hypothetical protein E2320_000483, partial [Naja naja]
MIRLRWEGKQQLRNWMLQRSILKEESFNKLLTSELELFFRENNPQDTSLQNNWDTAKAVMRGVSIKYMARKSKEKKQQREKLQQEYKEWVDKLQRVRTFLRENNPQDTSLQNNWDTAKAVMRGVSIKYMARKSKEKKQQREKLQQEYKEWVDKLQ